MSPVSLHVPSHLALCRPTSLLALSNIAEYKWPGVEVEVVSTSTPSGQQGVIVGVPGAAMQDGDDGGTFAEEVVVDDLLPPDNFAMVEEGLYRGAALP
jgi:hypothetical protein